MVNELKDAGVIWALLRRFETQRLPRALALKGKVDSGARLDQADIAFLDAVFFDGHQIMGLVERNPEYKRLVKRVYGLYVEITDKALENEKKR